MWPFGFGNKYPYTDFHELNADWILGKIRGLEDAMKKFFVNTTDTIIETVNKWLDDHPEATTTVQDGAITEVKFADSLKLKAIKDYVTPQMFGAKGDGVTDDTISVQRALNDGRDVFFPIGTYLISETLSISEGIVVFGSGSLSRIRYTGNDFLFNLETTFLKRPKLQGLYITGLDSNSFLRCSLNGSWGGTFEMENVVIYSFNLHVFQFESVAGCHISDVRIISKGDIVFTTSNGTFDGNNFSNGNLFENVYYTGINKTEIDHIFDLNNVKELLFVNCMFEKAKTCFLCKNGTSSVSMYGGWLELLDSVYMSDSSSSPVNIKGVKDISVTRYNGNATVFDKNFIADGSRIELLTSGGNKFDKLNEQENISLNNIRLVNPDDAYEGWGYIYSIGSKNSFLNTSLNTKTVEGTSTNTLDYNFKNDISYSSRRTIFVFYVMCEYEDTSLNIFKFNAFWNDGHLYRSNVETLFTATWSNAIAANATITTSVSGAKITITSSVNTRVLRVIGKYEFL